MLKIIYIIPLVIICNYQKSNAQCDLNCPPTGCNPITGSAYISSSPSCFSEYYEITIAGSYDFGWIGVNGVGWPASNGTFTAQFGETYEIQLYSDCWETVFYQYCFSYNEFGCNSSCLTCSTNTLEPLVHELIIEVPTQTPCFIEATVSSEPVSSYGCSDGSITVTATTNDCNGYFTSFLNIMNTPSGESVTWNNLPAGDYVVTAYNATRSECSQTFYVNIPEVPCLFTFDQTVYQPSDFMCMDDSVTINFSSGLCNGTLIYLVSGNDSSIYLYSLSSLDSITIQGLLPGTYHFTLMDIYGACQYSGEPFTIVNPPCEISADYIITPPLYYNCDYGTVEVTALTSSCTLWSASITDTMGFYTTSYTYPPGQTHTFDLQSGYYEMTISEYYSGCQESYSFYVNPQCQINTSIISNSETQITFTGIANNCFGYNIMLISHTSGDTSIYGNVGNADTVTLHGIFSGDYIMISQAITINGVPACMDVDSFTVDTLQFIVNLKMIVEGFYNGSGAMVPVLDPVHYPAIWDSVTVTLVDAGSLLPAASITDVISISGTGSFVFNKVELNDNALYYIVINHRNSIEVWSREAIVASGTIVYDFTN